jgi:hypothetical protein
MNMEKMLEIIETGAWVPRDKAEKGKATTSVRVEITSTGVCFVWRQFRF